MEKSKKASHSMSKILEKLKRYFGTYEFGVFREASDGKDGAVWAVVPDDDRIGYLKAMNAQGKHVFIRPTYEKESLFLLHDDVDLAELEKHHKLNGRWKPGRLAVETSPGNYQVWIKGDRPLTIDEKNYWLKKMDSDPGASPLHRWGRSPGFRNRKKKYKTENGYPLARLYHIDWARVAVIPEVEIEPEENKTVDTQNTTGNKCSTDGAIDICRDDYYKGVDKKGKVRESEQDMAYALALFRRGVHRSDIEARILKERIEWTNHKGPKRQHHYLTKTIDKAEAIINNSNYQVTVKNTAHNIEKSVTVKGVNKNEAQQVLRGKAKSMAVQIGFNSANDIEVDIKKAPYRKRKQKPKLIQNEIKNEDTLIH